VGWDAFTHPGAWGPDHLSVLRAQVGPLTVTKWLQYASGVLGLGGLLAWFTWGLRRRPAMPREDRLQTGRSVLRALPRAGLVLGVAAALSTLEARDGLHRLLVRAVTMGGVGGAGGLLSLAVCWTALDRRRLARPPLRH
jgi:hypothetical protein